MKKSKVDRLIKKFSRENFDDGKREGQLRERARWERILPPPGSVDQVCYIGPKPEALRFIVPLMERMPVQFPTTYDPSRYGVRFERIEFDAVPMALILATGQQFRWFHWKPVGPYPVTELGVLR